MIDPRSRSRRVSRRLIAVLILTLLGMFLSVMFGNLLITRAQVSEEQPTPASEPATTEGNKIYLPVVQNGDERLFEQDLPPNLPDRGLIYDGLRINPNVCRNGFQVGNSKHCTHGPDMALLKNSVAREADPLTARDLNAVNLTCEGDGVTGNRVQVLYARATDRADRYSQYLPSLQQWATDADQIFYDSATETGGTRRIRFVHDSNCTLSIPNVVLSATADDNFSNTITELEALGYTRSDRKYMIFMDATILCGIGTLYGDDQSAQANANNFGPSYGRTDAGCWGGHTAAHEFTHNLGGVQNSAPHTSGGYHCVDEYDVMCYSDSPNYPAMQYLCPSSAQENRLDCNHDDYYHTNPTAGSYLSSHWNVANSQFLINTNLPTPTPTFTPTPTNTPLPGCSIYASSNVPLAIQDLVTVDSILNVPSSFTLTDVNVVNLNLAHTWDTDVDLFLISPSGTQVELFTDVGGSDDNFINTVLDDSATIAITAGVAPFTGRYRPEGLLSAFTGQTASGTWRLRIADDEANDTGTLNGWALELCTSSTATATPTSTPVPATSTATSTSTSTATSTATNTATSTPVPPTNTATNTPVPPTSTPTRTPVPASGTLRAVKYRDLNNDRRRNNTEPYLSGWVMKVYNSQGVLVNTLSTNGSGQANFTVPIGQYTVCETLVSGWTNTEPGSINTTYAQPCYTVTVNKNKITTATFGNR